VNYARLHTQLQRTAAVLLRSPPCDTHRYNEVSGAARMCLAASEGDAIAGFNATRMIRSRS